MILKPEVHKPDDVTIGYLIDIAPEKLHSRLNLPGKFVKNYPTRIIKRDGSEREMDWLMLVEPDYKTLFEPILINVEFQSSKVTKKKIKAMADYKDYSKTYYGLPVLTVVVITDGFENSELEYCKVSSDVFKPLYIHMNEDEVIKRLKNIEEKITNHENLSDDDAIDIVFLPMFAPKNKAQEITEKITRLFRRDESLTGTFRNDIGFALSLMIRKHFDLTPKGEELLKMMNPEVSNSRLRDVIDYEVDYARKAFEKELKEKDEENAEKLAKKDNEIKFLKEKLEENNISY